MKSQFSMLQISEDKYNEMSDSNLKKSKNQKFSHLNFSLDPDHRHKRNSDFEKHVSSCFVKKSKPAQNMIKEPETLKKVKSSKNIQNVSLKEESEITKMTGPSLCKNIKLPDTHNKIPHIESQNSKESNQKSSDRNNKRKKKTVNRYDLFWNEDELEAEMKRLKPLRQGPLILVARNRKEYFKIMSLRKLAIFKLKKLIDFESSFSPEDKYFDFARDYRNKLAACNERNIRDFLKFFYFKQ